MEGGRLVPVRICGTARVGMGWTGRLAWLVPGNQLRRASQTARQWDCLPVDPGRRAPRWFQVFRRYPQLSTHQSERHLKREYFGLWRNCVERKLLGPGRQHVEHIWFWGQHVLQFRRQHFEHIWFWG